MSAARQILLSLLLAPLAALAGDYPLIDPLPEGGAGSGGIGRVTQSMYRGEGARFDYLPANLFFGERVYMHADRIGIKKDVDATLRLDMFLAHRYEGTPLDASRRCSPGWRSAKRAPTSASATGNARAGARRSARCCTT